MMRILLLTLAYIVATCNAAAAAQMSVGLRQRMLTPIVVGVRRATMNSSQQRYATKSDLIQPSVTSVSRGGTAICDSKPPVKLLQWAYAAAGMATTAGWGTMAYTTIRDNQPAGAMMPCWQHPVFARIGAMSAAVSCVCVAKYHVDCTSPSVLTVSFSNYYMCAHFHSSVSHTRIICKSRCYVL